MSKVRIFCGTISDVELKNNGEVLLYFHDGSIRSYPDAEEHFNHFKKINGLESCGSYYRAYMRDKGLKYEEIKPADPNKPIVNK